MSETKMETKYDIGCRVFWQDATESLIPSMVIGISPDKKTITVTSIRSSHTFDVPHYRVTEASAYPQWLWSAK